MSTKENKQNTTSISVAEMSVPELKLEQLIEIKDESVLVSRKRHISESALSCKENKDTADSVDNSTEVQIELVVNKRKKHESSSTDRKATTASRKSIKKKSQIAAEVVKAEKIDDSASPINIDSCQMPDSEVGIKNEMELGDNETNEPLKKEFVDDEKVPSMSHHSDFSDDIGAKPKTRCRAKSSSTKLSNNMSVASAAQDKSDIDDSVSPSVDSDNLADEDFRPATSKAKRLTKKVKTPKRTKSPAKKTPTQPKKSPMKQKTVSKKKQNLKVDSDDSLSSISSVEDWKVKDAKMKKDMEEKLKVVQRQQLEMEEKAVKEASRRSKAKRLSESLAVENVVGNGVKKASTTIAEEKATDLNGCKLEKEAVVHIGKADIIGKPEEKTVDKVELLDATEDKVPVDTKVEAKVDTYPSEDSKVCDTPVQIDIVDIKPDISIKKTRNSKMFDLLELGDEEEPISVNKLPETSTTTDAPAKQPTVDKLAETPTNKPTEKITESTPTIVEKIKKVKINLKELRAEKSAKKSKSTSRKRNRKISSSASGSDVEIVSVKPKESEPKSKRARIVEKSSESDENNTKPEPKHSDKVVVDRLQILQSFNVDIRSSLMLGHEDYRVCLERMKSLCEMDIDLVSLVKVWQLMDTVKKVRYCEYYRGYRLLSLLSSSAGDTSATSR